jgi:hypothetical protein
MQWARLTADVDIKIRRGAWYKVLRLGPLEAVLDVNRKPTPVPRQYLRLTPQPPQAWSLVQRPSRSARLPQSWGQVYAVCPNCRERAPLLEGRPANQRCHKCNGFFAIAWDEA